MTTERKRTTELARENTALMTELGPRVFGALAYPAPDPYTQLLEQGARDLYVILCPLGHRSDELTLIETAQIIGMLAGQCGETHEIRPAEDMPALDQIAADIAANRAPF
jgi:hypothetical protein